MMMIIIIIITEASTMGELRVLIRAIIAHFFVTAGYGYSEDEYTVVKGKFKILMVAKAKMLIRSSLLSYLDLRMPALQSPEYVIEC